MQMLNVLMDKRRVADRFRDSERRKLVAILGQITHGKPVRDQNEMQVSDVGDSATSLPAGFNVLRPRVA